MLLFGACFVAVVLVVTKVSGIDVGQPVPLYPRAPPQVSLRSFLEEQAADQASLPLVIGRRSCLSRERR